MSIAVNPRPDLLGLPTESKWGAIVTSGAHGYQLVPNLLLRYQHQLGMDAADVVVLLNILMHWWEREPDKMPHPRPTTIAKRIGTSTRTVERHIGRLSKLGLLEWLPSENLGEGLSVRRFNLDGLKAKLSAIAAQSDPKDMAA